MSAYRPAIETAMAAAERLERPEGRQIPTSFVELDTLLGGGLLAGTVTLLFGAPGVGTSTLALNIASNGAITGTPVLHVSWESTLDLTHLRTLSAVARVHMPRLLSGVLPDADLSKVAAALSKQPFTGGQTKVGNLHHCEPPSTLHDLIEVIRQFAAGHAGGPSLIVLDGAPNLARTSARPDSNAWEEHSRLAATLKALAVELGLAVIATAPVVREALSGGAWQKAKLSDVAYSPAYVTDADLVIRLHREDLHEPESPRAGEADLIVLKSKYTPNATITVAFQGHYARFVSIVE